MMIQARTLRGPTGTNACYAPCVSFFPVTAIVVSAAAGVNRPSRRAAPAGIHRADRANYNAHCDGFKVQMKHRSLTTNSPSRGMKVSEAPVLFWSVRYNWERDRVWS